jgi:hypothetical protein
MSGYGSRKIAALWKHPKSCEAGIQESSNVFLIVQSVSRPDLCLLAGRVWFRGLAPFPFSMH